MAILAQEPAKPVLEQLDPPRRVAVVMTIIGLVILGLMLVAGVMIGAHWVRRMARQRPRAKQPTPGSQSSLKDRPLRETLLGSLPEVDTGATVQIDPASSETKIDR